MRRDQNGDFFDACTPAVDSFSLLCLSFSSIDSISIRPFRLADAVAFESAAFFGKSRFGIVVRRLDRHG